MKEYFSNDNISVLSLSSCNDSELMWAIYAGSHTGYAIGLRVNNNIFSSDFWEDEKINVGLRKVVYKNEREKFYLEDRDNFCLNTLLFKSKSWEYENEWRLIISNIEKLHSIDIKKGEDNITVNGFLRFPDEAISEIILGYRAEKRIEEQAKEFCKKHNVVLKKAVVDEKNIKLI